MSISGYTPPQLQIRQTLVNDNTASKERLHALLVGPQKHWPDLSTDEVPEVKPTAANIEYQLQYTNAEGDVVTPVAAEGYKIDESSLSFFAKNAEIPLHTSATLTGESTLTAPTNLVLDDSGPVVLKGTNLDAEFKGRDIQVGDTVHLTESSTSRTATRKVVGFIGKLDAAASVSALGGAGSNPVTTVASAIAGTASSKYASMAGGLDATDMGNSAIRDEVRNKGYFFNDVSGGVTSTKAGTKATIRLTSYDTGAGTGTYIATFADGLTAPVTGTVSFSDPTLTFSSLTRVSTLAGVNAAAALTADVSTGYEPAVGDEFVVEATVAYEPLTATEWDIAYPTPGTTPDNNRFYVKVKEGNDTDAGDITVSIYDRNGTLPSSDVVFSVDAAEGVATADVELGDSGITLSFTNLDSLSQHGLRTGDLYYIDYTAPSYSTTDFGGVVLDGPAAIGDASTQDLTVKFRKDINREITTTDFSDGNIPYSLDTATGIVTLTDTSGWTVYDPDFSAGNKYPEIVDNDGSPVWAIYITWKAFVQPGLGEDIVGVYAGSDLTQLGEYDQDNPLGFATTAAFSGSEGKAVFALRTEDDSVEAFTEALKKAESQDHLYAICPLTEDKAVADVVKAHVDGASQEDVKNFRRMYWGVDSPGEYLALDTDSEGAAYTATVTAYGTGNLRVTFESDAGLTALSLSDKDYLTIDGGSYEIASVTSDTELILKTGPGAPITTAAVAKIWRADTADATGDYIINLAKGFDSRRVSTVWIDNGYGVISGTTLSLIKNQFLAAYVAGVRSAVTPWLGLSKRNVGLVTSAPTMYLKFTKSKLDEIASNGVFIITQLTEGGEVYVRHQLTTDTDEGILNQEDSVGVNVDDLSFQFKAVLEPLIGITNVTKATISFAKDKCTDILADALQNQTDPLIGPQIINYFNAAGEEGDFDVYQHPTFKDRIMIRVFVEVPVPNNTTIVELVAST